MTDVISNEQTGLAIKNATEQLPDGCSIELRIFNNEFSTKLLMPSGNDFSFAGHSLAEEINQLTEKALSERNKVLVLGSQFQRMFDGIEDNVTEVDFSNKEVFCSEEELEIPELAKAEIGDYFSSSIEETNLGNPIHEWIVTFDDVDVEEDESWWGQGYVIHTIDPYMIFRWGVSSLDGSRMESSAEIKIPTGEIISVLLLNRITNGMNISENDFSEYLYGAVMVAIEKKYKLEKEFTKFAQAMEMDL